MWKKHEVKGKDSLPVHFRTREERGDGIQLWPLLECRGDPWVPVTFTSRDRSLRTEERRRWLLHWRHPRLRPVKTIRLVQCHWKKSPRVRTVRVYLREREGHGITLNSPTTFFYRGFRWPNEKCNVCTSGVVPDVTGTNNKVCGGLHKIPQSQRADGKEKRLGRKPRSGTWVPSYRVTNSRFRGLIPSRV